MDWISIHRLSFLTLYYKTSLHLDFGGLSAFYEMEKSRHCYYQHDFMVYDNFINLIDLRVTNLLLFKIQLGTTSECMSTSVVNFIFRRKDEKFLPTITSETKSFQALSNVSPYFCFY